MRKQRDILKSAVNESFLTENVADIFESSTDYKTNVWMFNLKSVLGASEYIDAYTDAFALAFKDKHPFQLTGLEAASLPILGAVSQKMRMLGKPVDYFYIRKSRKKHGLLNLIEGKINEFPIVSVDDIINSGNSLLKQQAVLESLGKKISYSFTLISLKDKSYYESFEKKHNIKILSEFSLEQIKSEIGINFPFVKKTREVIINPYKIKWTLNNPKKNFFYIIPKSSPIVYNDFIYYGRDDGAFLCVDKNGIVIWSHKISFGARGKMIFSTPILFKDRVIFGAYDGNLYCLDAVNGKVLWVNFEADWIGSSPDISIKGGCVFIGCEYGLWSKKGGISCVDIETGVTKWTFRDSKEHVHGSPLVVEKYNMVICGSNDSKLYALDIKDGTLLWSFICSGAIKNKPAFSQSIIVVTDHKGGVYGLDRMGKKIWFFEVLFGSFCTPLIEEEKVYVTSFDKCIYCLNLRTGDLVWKDRTSARVFSSVEVFKNRIIFGSNAGILYEYDKNNGERISEQFFPERITNKVSFDGEHENLFVLDYVGDLYCLEYKNILEK